MHSKSKLENRLRAVYNSLMDCITFRKDIDDYLSNNLDDAELNDFLHHLESCKDCAEELEINFIVREGVKIFEQNNVSYNISRAFKDNISYNQSHIKFVKLYKRLAYCISSVALWALLASVFVFFRVISF